MGPDKYWNVGYVLGLRSTYEIGGILERKRYREIGDDVVDDIYVSDDGIGICVRLDRKNQDSGDAE